MAVGGYLDLLYPQWPAYDLAIVLLTNARHSPIKGSEKRYQFVGKNFETAQYGSIVSLIYEALLNQ